MSGTIALAEDSSTMHLNLVLLLGILVLAGTAAARLAKRFRVPRVVAYVIIGIIVGNSALNLLTLNTVNALKPFTMFALGIIGFMIGGELRRDIFKKYGKQFFIILLSEGTGAFILTSIIITLAGWLLTKDLQGAVAIGLVVGAIASATAPAATVNVLWEYKTRGPLTATILAIVALDDALALLLYRAAATAANACLGTGNGSFPLTTGILFVEILGAIILGFVVGLLLYFLLNFIRADDVALTLTIAALLLVVGISMLFDIDPILSAMTLGITITNLAPRKSKKLFQLLGKFSPPIYVIFFVIAGAHMEFARLTFSLVIMIVLYGISRASGKILGSWFGAGISHAPATVRKYLGICLLPQAGVAIGLAILARQQFNSEVGYWIVMIVMTATFLAEILGPPLVKLGVKKAGEIGLNITKEDLIKDYNVSDIMDTKPAIIQNDLPISKILETFSSSDSLYYPVVDKESKVVGIITIEGIKETFANQDAVGWLLACDVMEPVTDKVTSDEPLEEALEYMQDFNLENIPVVETRENNKLLGVLDFKAANRRISAEVLNRRQLADGMAAT